MFLYIFFCYFLFSRIYVCLVRSWQGSAADLNKEVLFVLFVGALFVGLTITIRSLNYS